MMRSYNQYHARSALGLAIASQKIPHWSRPELFGSRLIDYLSRERIQSTNDLVMDGSRRDDRPDFVPEAIGEYFGYYRHAQDIMNIIDRLIFEANLKEGKGRKGGCIIAGGSPCDMATGGFTLQNPTPIKDCDLFLYGLPEIEGQPDGDANGEVIHPLVQTIVEALCEYAYSAHNCIPTIIKTMNALTLTLVEDENGEDEDENYVPWFSPKIVYQLIYSRLYPDALSILAGFDIAPSRIGFRMVQGKPELFADLTGAMANRFRIYPFDIRLSPDTMKRMKRYLEEKGVSITFPGTSYQKMAENTPFPLNVQFDTTNGNPEIVALEYYASDRCPGHKAQRIPGASFTNYEALGAEYMADQMVFKAAARFVFQGVAPTCLPCSVNDLGQPIGYDKLSVKEYYWKLFSEIYYQSNQYFRRPNDKAVMASLVYNICTYLNIREDGFKDFIMVMFGLRGVRTYDENERRRIPFETIPEFKVVFNVHFKPVVNMIVSNLGIIRNAQMTPLKSTVRNPGKQWTGCRKYVDITSAEFYGPRFHIPSRVGYPDALYVALRNLMKAEHVPSNIFHGAIMPYILRSWMMHVFETEMDF